MINKVVRRIKASYSDFRKYSSNFSISYGFWRMITIMLAGGYSKKLTNYAWRKRHEFVCEYLFDRYGHILSELEEMDIKGESSLETPKYIWVSWWQGMENAPELVKSCYKNLLQKKEDAQVFLITKDNFHQYVSIPDYILKKVEIGTISMAALSDILRASLLERWGGVWLDATIYLSRPLEKECFNSYFYTARKKKETIDFISNYKWTGFFIAGNKKFPLWRFLRKFYLEYWEKENHIIDYLLPDYAIHLAYSNIPSIKKYMDMVPFNNVKIDDLIAVFDQAYDEREYEQICNSDTFVFKLGYREEQYLQKKTKEGKDTFYSVVLGIK